MPHDSMKDKIMVALDVNSKTQALAMRDTLGDSVGWLKVGLRLFVAEGPSLISSLTQTHKVFLDLKFHDIPNTVAQAIESAGALGVQMVNVHAGGGLPMLQAASQAAQAFPEMKLIAVTVLTSDTMPKEQALTVALERAKLQGLMVWCVACLKLRKLNKYVAQDLSQSPLVFVGAIKMHKTSNALQTRKWQWNMAQTIW